MITIFDIIQLAFPILGAAIGFRLGTPFGSWVSIVFAIIGLLVGYILGRLPLILSVFSLKNNFRKKSAKDLREDFAKDDCLIPNVLLLELLSRGEDISNELEIVLKRLDSDNIDSCSRAWIALKSAFPDVATMISDYHFSDSPEVRKSKIEKLMTSLNEQKSINNH